MVSIMRDWRVLVYHEEIYQPTSLSSMVLTMQDKRVPTYHEDRSPITHVLSIYDINYAG